LIQEKLIRETLRLAKKGLGKVSPNPMVGAVIVKSGEIISKGYHRFFGGEHAEIDAIKRAEKDIRRSTLYVNMEPCFHFGKTPPCVKAIVQAGIKKVVIGDIDPNPRVKGKGINYLKENGVNVTYGILVDECRKLNEFYYKYMVTKMPYVGFKIAQTVDGKISEKKGKSTNITSKESRRIVHRIRSLYDAVLIGKNTAVIDNPALTVRLCKGRSPKRIILDENLKIDTRLNLLNRPLSENTLIFTTSEFDHEIKEKLLSKGVEIILAKKDKNGLIDLKYMLRESAKLEISSIIVEGGSRIFTSFINERLVDKIYLFIAPKLFIKGINTFSNSVPGLELIKNINLKFEKIKKIKSDLMIEAVLK